MNVITATVALFEIAHEESLKFFDLANIFYFIKTFSPTLTSLEPLSTNIEPTVKPLEINDSLL